jgi:ABC-type antimicrobial peptide transport system permease subunit
MTVFGIGFTVSIVITMMALVQGLESIFVETGHQNHLIVVRQGSVNEINSYFARDLFQTIRYLPGIAKGANGETLVCGETVVVINHARIGGKTSNILVRGTSETGFYLRPEVRIAEGRRFRHGLREIIASRALSRRFEDLTLGSTIHIARSDWKVVGVFDAGGTAYDSEIWADYTEVSEEWERPVYSSILLQAESTSAAADIKKRIADDRRINLQAVPQREYYADQTSTSIGIRAIGYLIAILMGIGASFAAMNMMYGAVMSRSREIATMRALGFRGRSILASFLIESIILGFLGGAFGCLLALPMHGISTGTANFRTFSEVLFNFRITPAILLRGLAFATLVGALGGYLPARRAARVKLIDLMRE